MANVQVTFDNNPSNARSESFVAINPSNPLQIVAASKRFTNIHTYDFTLATEYSSDGGQTWQASAPLALPQGATVMTDPTLAWDDSNNVFLVGLTGFNPPTWDTIGMVIFQSNDGGQTWSPPNPIHNSSGDDKQWAAGDAFAGSAHKGNVYAIWDNGGLAFARTTDHGATWTGTAGAAAGNLISSGTVYPEITVADGGTVMIVSTDAASVIKMLVSHDGGNSFQSTTDPASGITTLEDKAPSISGWNVLPGGTFRVISDPTIASRGGITLVAWADYRDHASRIYYVRSTDGGNTWSTPSGEPLLTQSFPSTIHHVMPQMVVDAAGVFGCVYYEFGPKPTNMLIDVVISLSFDGGLTFGRTVLTDEPWDPTIDAPWSHGNPAVTFIGDYMGLDASARGFQPLWTDTRTGMQELFTATVPADLGLCIVEFLNELSSGEMRVLRVFRDEQMAQSPLGRRLTSVIQRHGPEVAQHLTTDRALQSQAADIVRRAFDMVRTARSSDPGRVDEAMVQDLTTMADRFSQVGSPSLKRDIQRMRPELDRISGKTAAEILQ
jgi:hypothetical protein